MRTLEFKSENKQIENSIETLEIFIPLANHIGAYKIKRELEDLVFYYLTALIVSLVVTLLVTKWFRKIVNNGKLIYFSTYCFIVGLLVIVLL